MRKKTGIWEKITKNKSSLHVFLVLFIFVGTLLSLLSGDTKGTAANFKNMSDYITWSGGKLEVDTDGEWAEIDADSAFEFSHENYRFSISWKADIEQSYQEGDYFTFSVPAEFTDLPVKMVAESENILGEIHIDEEGNGTATFTGEVEELPEISGELSFERGYSESEENVQVNWEFIFSNDEKYVYTGENTTNTNHVADSTTDEEDKDTNYNSKYSVIGDGTSEEVYASENITWSNGVLEIYRNDFEGGEDWYEVPVNDYVFPYLSENRFTISWEVNSEHSYEEGDYLSFIVPKEFGTYKSVYYSDDGETELGEIAIDENGNGTFTFTPGIVDMSDIRGEIELVGNNVEKEEEAAIEWTFTFDDKTYEYTGMSAGESLEPSAMMGFNPVDMHGEKGNLKIYKIGSDGKLLEGTEFRLIRSDSINGPFTGETVAPQSSSNGEYIFRLSDLGKLNAYYQLSEIVEPYGYKIGYRDIVIGVNGSGKITQLKYGGIEYIPEADTKTGVEVKGSKGNRIFYISGDRFALAIYNTKLPTVDFSFTKVDALEETIKLDGAGFQLYYVVNYEGKKVKKYYSEDSEGNVIFITDGSKATPITSNTNGEVNFKGLVRGIYTLVETSTPKGYEKPEGQWQIVVEGEEEIAKITSITTINADKATLDFSKEYNKLGNVPKTTSFDFIKVDASDDETTIKGAGFQLYFEVDYEGNIIKKYYSEDSEGNVIFVTDENKATTIFSDATGKVSFKGLRKGTYTLEETVVPNSYQRPEGYWVLTAEADEEENVIITNVKSILREGNAITLQRKENGNYLLENTLSSTINFTFKKVSADYTEQLSGAEFQMYYYEGVTRKYYSVDNDGNVIWREGEYEYNFTRDDGLFTFKELPNGKYYLVETKAPKGYQLPTGYWEIEVGTHAIDTKDKIKITYVADGDATVPPAIQEEIDEAGNRTGTFLIGNAKSYTLPQTGGRGTYWFKLLGCLSIGISCLWFYKKASFKVS